MTPGDRLRKTRKERGLTPAELGKRAAQIMGRDRPLTASAVRNQENGTNGIPLDVANAYAKVLDINAVWLVFGEISEEDNQKNRRVPILSWVSSLWHRPTANPYEVEGGRFVSVDFPGFDFQGGVAYEVLDNSMEPVFSAGDFLITTPLDGGGVEHDIVLVFGKFASETLCAVRRIIHNAEGFHLGPVGLDDKPPLLPFADIEKAGLWISARVVYAIRRFREFTVPDNE